MIIDRKLQSGRTRAARCRGLSGGLLICMLLATLFESVQVTAEESPATSYSIFAGTMADMTYTELEAATRAGAVALWGLGVIEEHGPHLPLGTDVYVPTATLHLVQAKLQTVNKISSVIVPAYYWGVNQVTGSFAGSIDIRPEIMVEVMIDVFKSLKKAGFNDVFCLSGHGDAAHNRALFEGVKRGAAAASIRVHLVVAPAMAARLGLDANDPHLLLTADTSPRPTGPYADVHAGGPETSMMWGSYPRVVRDGLISGLKPTNLGPKDLQEWRKGYEHARRKTPDGYLGAPAEANPETGRKLIEANAAGVADAIAARMAKVREANK
jgi:creatinine amidohydrolase